MMHGTTGALDGSRLTASLISTLLGILGLAFLVVIAAFTAWNERTILFQEGRDHAEQETYFLAEHAQRLFEVSDIALHATSSAIAGLDWSAVERAPGLLSDMRHLEEMLPYVDVLLLADETGLVRRSTPGRCAHPVFHRAAVGVSGCPPGHRRPPADRRTHRRAGVAQGHLPRGAAADRRKRAFSRRGRRPP